MDSSSFASNLLAALLIASQTRNEPPLVFIENHHVLALDPADPIHITI